MPHGTEIGLDRGHIVLDGDPAIPSPKGGGHSSQQFSAHIYCDQTVGWIRIPFGTEVGLGPGDIVLNRDPLPPYGKSHSSPPLFGALCSGTVAHLSNC